MKNKLLFLSLLLLTTGFVYGQTDGKTITENYLLSDDELKIDSLSNEPEKWDNLLDFIEKYDKEKKSKYWKWLNSLHLKFKTFQNKDSTKSSLGLSYHFNLERAVITEKKNIKNGQSFSFESTGNISFSKIVNPYNFLHSRVSLNRFHTGGGIKIIETDNDLVYYANLRRKLAMYGSANEIIASPEWKEMNEKFVLKNSWIIKYDLNAGFESNQDFSKTQNTYGLRIGMGLKSWNKNSLASKLNLIDYPFELIRTITRYSGNIHTGITIPSLMLGFDYVNPLNDVIRKNIEGELTPFPRVNVEIGFRTVLTEVSNQILYFNSAFKYYKEIGASSNLKANHYVDFTYFTASLVTSSGFYTSYSYGKLPLDRENDAVYEIGFKYKFD